MAGGRKRKEKEVAEISVKRPKAEETANVSSSEEEAGPSSTASEGGIKVHPKRVRELRGGTIEKGPVIYW